MRINLLAKRQPEMKEVYLKRAFDIMVFGFLIAFENDRERRIER